MVYNYDLLVLGAGSAGLAAARRSAAYGIKVAIVEQAQLGGTCTNRGCVPKKLMVYASDFSRHLADARAYGWSMPGDSSPGDSSPAESFNWQQFVSARNQELDRIHQSQQQALSEAGIDIIRGQAAFLDAHTVEIVPTEARKAAGKAAGKDIESHSLQRTADKILIAVGGKPNKLAIPGIDRAITSREMFDLPDLPARFAVIGGGYIGVEFASMMRGFGAEVTLIEHSRSILSGFDQDVQAAVQSGLTDRNIQIFCDTATEAIRSTAQGLELVLSGACATPVTADTVLCATGRSPNLETLNLENAAVEVADKAIAVDIHSRTSQDNIYAVGDCTNRLPLTPVARAEGYAFADHVFGNQPRQLDYDTVPSAVFARPEAATVGMTEAQAREQYGDEAVQCCCTPFIPLFDRLSPSPQPSLFKQVIHKDSDRVLGVHLVSKHAAEIIQGIALALKKGITVHDLENTIGIHPTSAEELFE